jgi:hypothetical protein
MTYNDWFEAHAAKHRVIMDKLSHLRDDEVIKYFRFENMVIHESDFCPLYAENKKCHDVAELNCYLCACPHFRFNDEGIDKVKDKTRYSLCSIDSKDGARYENDNAIHQNCAGCTVPHDEKFIAKVFDSDWSSIMKKSPPKR